MAAKAARRRRLARRALVGAFSVAVHAVLLLAVLSGRHDPVATPPVAAMAVELVSASPAPQTAAPPAPTAPATPPPPPRALARRAPTRPDVAPLPAGEGRTDDTGVQLSEAQVAGAATAGSGASGRPCDMIRRLQAALRKDPRIQAAVADAPAAGGRPLFVWNGDWIRSRGQEGNGLAAVREAIMWEVAFAPEACRAEPVHGLVLLSLNDAPGAARLVVGGGDWRWSDLLRLHPAG